MVAANWISSVYRPTHQATYAGRFVKLDYCSLILRYNKIAKYTSYGVVDDEAICFTYGPSTYWEGIMRLIIALAVISSGVLLRPDHCYAQDASSAATDSATTEAQPPAAPKDGTERQNNGSGLNDFLSNFSIGAAVLIFRDPSVETAEFVGENRIVVVTESKKHSVTPWLQANYVWDAAYDRGLWFAKSTAPGIFAGVGMGPDGSFLDTFGVGGQIAFRRIAKNKSLNLGVGYYFTTKRELADGIIDGEKLPADFDQIKIVKKSATGLMLNLSFGFQ